MTREEKCQLAIEKGISYNPDTGKIYGVTNKEILNKSKKGYIRIGLYHNKKCYYLFGHQFAWYWVNKEIVEQIDHIDYCKDNNKINNLRAVNNQQNHFNKPNVKGYYWYKRDNKFVAQIHINGKTINLGRFNTEEEAREAYLKAKEKYHKF